LRCAMAARALCNLARQGGWIHWLTASCIGWRTATLGRMNRWWSITRWWRAQVGAGGGAETRNPAGPPTVPNQGRLLLIPITAGWEASPWTRQETSRWGIASPAAA